jgi:dinuclear metal center YbgI/SA1388 family protein
MSTNRIQDIAECLEAIAPLELQEDYDNCGLLAGDKNDIVKGVLLSLDCTESVIDEAIQLGCNMVVSHHPLIFSGLKKLTPTGYVQRTLLKAIRNNIAIYACHTNIDNIPEGVNKKICDKLGLKGLKILAPKEDMIRKLVTYVPESHHEKVLEALFENGAGKIGNYDSCSFNIEGTGTFRGNETSSPFIGKPGELSREKEIRIETIFNVNDEKRLLSALRNSHPYEEIAFDIYALNLPDPNTGSGMIGCFEKEMDEKDFLKLVKSTFGAGIIKHTPLLKKHVKKVAVCGGSGRFLLRNAIARGADAFITADFKYHDYFDADGRILVADVGHFETERFTPEIFYDIIRKKFTTFAIHLSKINTNPVNYF